MIELARKWLTDYQVLKNDAIYTEHQINKYKKELNRWVYGDLSSLKTEPESRSSRLEDILADLEHELALILNDMHDLKKIVNELEGLEHQILYQKHIEGKKLNAIADDLNMSPNYIYNKHAEIMRKLNFKYCVT
ncbi:MAG: hypothetical protein RR595_09800 [Lysinibacillus sp.]